MTTRTQIIEGLKAAKHGHIPFCAVQVHAPCNCGADGRNARIDAAITELSKPKAVQAEAVASVSEDDVVALINALEGLEAIISGELSKEWDERFQGDFDNYQEGMEILKRLQKVVHPAPKPADEQSVGEKYKFTCNSTATPTVKARRFIESLADKKDTRYFFDDGYPRERDLQQDAMAALDVFDQLTTPRPPAPDVLAVLDELEIMALTVHDDECSYTLELQDADCDCMAKGPNEDVRTLTAKLRSLLSNTHNQEPQK